MTVEQIYADFGTPQNLRQHMLFVGAVTWFALDNWVGEPIASEAILLTSLFHDIAKPITFNLDAQDRFVRTNEEQIALREHRQLLRERYGTDEHQALQQIFRELGFDPKTLELIAHFDWNRIPTLLENHDVESLIPIYCDMRVSPTGFVTVQERIHELNGRHPIPQLEVRLQSADKLESLMAQNMAAGFFHLTEGEVAEKAAQLAEYKPLNKSL